MVLERRVLRILAGTAPIVRLLSFSILLITATVLATAITHILVPPAPSPAHQWIVVKNLLLPIVLIWLYGRAVCRLEHREPVETSLSKVPVFSLGFVLGVAMISTYVLVLWGSGSAHFSRGAITYGILANLNEILVPWLTSVVEELLFRLILFRIAEDVVGTGLATLISALLFGLSHAANPAANATNLLLLTGGVGILLALGFAATRSLWFPVGLHMGWNLAEGFLFGLPNSGQEDPLQIMHTSVRGPAMITGGAFGPEGSYPLFLLTLMVSAVLLAWTARKGRWRSFRESPFSMLTE